MNKTAAALRRAALGHEGVEEGIACAGTALESRTVKVRGKAFLFLGPKSLRLKLDVSLAEAQKMATKDPARYTAGAKGWVAVTYGDDLPLRVLERWVTESYRVMGGEVAPAKKKKK